MRHYMQWNTAQKIPEICEMIFFIFTAYIQSSLLFLFSEVCYRRNDQMPMTFHAICFHRQYKQVPGDVTSQAALQLMFPGDYL